MPILSAPYFLVQSPPKGVRQARRVDHDWVQSEFLCSTLPLLAAVFNRDPPCSEGARLHEPAFLPGVSV